MARQWLLTVEMKCTNGIPRDATSMSFPIQTSDAGFLLSGAQDVMELWLDTVNAAQGTGLSVAARIAPSRSRAVPVTRRLYEVTGHLDGSPHGSPAFVLDVGGLAAGGGEGSLPDEVAVVMTTRDSSAFEVPVEAPDGADPGGAVDRPRQRRTGRNFWGPLSTEPVSALAGGVPAVKTGFVTDLLDWAEDWADGLNALGHNWCVWSRVDGQFRTVDSVEVDNAFDTQRRRGVRPTVRTSRTVS